MIVFTAFGHSVPALRPRAFAKKGGGVGMHNDERHTSWMQSIAMQALAYRPKTPLDEPLAVTIDVYILRPSSVSKKRKWPSVKPDLSNYLKAVEDACNGIIWVDDARIVKLTAQKHYSDTPRVEIMVLRYEEED